MHSHLKLHPLAALTFALSIFTTYGPAAAAPSIVGGQRVGELEWPAYTSASVATDQTCSGVLIAPQWILTAAHCSEGLMSASLRAIATFGVDPSDAQAPFSLIDRVVLHPLYRMADPDSFLGGYDLALLHLSDPQPASAIVATIAPLTLPSPSDALLLTGYGAFRAGASSVAPRLRKIMLGQRTAKSVPEEPRLNNALLLIADQSQAGGACTGDSGGGVYVYQSGKPYLVGIVAGGPKDCTGYSAITRVAPQIDWIMQVTAP